MRQVVLDTETTGLDWSQGHRIIEIGCVEILDRRISKSYFHTYINPSRAIDVGAQQVHGISADFLADKPVFSKIADQFLSYVADAELIIHNAPFDLGFLNAEFEILDKNNSPIDGKCSIFDTLTFAREKHPGQRNSLDALCKRYNVDNQNRIVHGALLDANLLAEVYLAMTGGQTSMQLQENREDSNIQNLEKAQYFKNDFIEAAVSNTDIETDANYFSDHSSSQQDRS
ncbi:MAG: DNA polymerase III subunit epsilon [Pseudomonadota bacterium]|nr:DNA polymerase III subunit epsilon [Pseudomonadota bacterium]